MSGAERRETTRLLPTKETYVAMRPDFVRLGKVLDISRGGLCIQYMSKDDGVQSGVKLDVDLFIGGNGFYLPDIECKLVHLRQTEQTRHSPVGMVSCRCGMQFLELSPPQQEQLQLFIEEHTSAPAPVE